MGTLKDVLTRSDDSVAIICAEGGPVVSRGQLRRLVLTVANTLREVGIRPGDVVSFADVNSLEFVALFLGITYARAIAAPLNQNYKASEFKFFMEDASSKLLVVPPAGNKEAQEAATRLRVPVASFQMVATQVSAAPLKPVFRGLSQGLQMPTIPGLVLEGAASREAPRPDDTALFLHTSGTTSRPKGVPLSHGNLVASLQNIAATYELSAVDRSLLVMPLFHVHGLMAGLLAPLFAGGSVILPKAGRFTAHSFWTDAILHAATYYTAVPTIHQVLLARAEKEYPKADPPPLRFIRSCSSSLAPATLEKVEAAFGVPVLEAYAMTEASHQMTSNPLPKHGPRKPGSVGRAQGSVAVAILDGQCRELPPGQVGEVCIRGPNVTRGYLNRPEANKEAFEGGWFHTGDQGWLDQDGYLTLTGRLKELINRGGEKISPLEVDGTLLSHPAVAEAVSFGAPDEKYGEVVAAAVVLRAGAAEAGTDEGDMKRSIQEHCRSKLAAFKVPTIVFITDKLPKTATGKIQRRFMVGHFISGKASPAPAAAPAAKPAAAAAPVTGYDVVARALAAAGVKMMYGVVGIPVTALATSAQMAGVRFIGTRNEQAAGYAAASAGFLTGTPAALLTVAGPGMVNGLSGLSHADANCCPMVMICGSPPRSDLGKGAFQELDHVAVAKPFCKFAVKVASVAAIPTTVEAACEAAIRGRPGPSLIDVPSDLLMETLPALPPLPPRVGPPPRAPAAAAPLAAAVKLLLTAQRPAMLVGKGAVVSGADKAVAALAERFSVPVLAGSMARGLLPDKHVLSAQAARSMVLAQADVVLVVGTRLNWQWHFGEPPKWNPGGKKILVNIAPELTDQQQAAAVLQGDAAAVLEQLRGALAAAAPPTWRKANMRWMKDVARKGVEAEAKLERRLQQTAAPMDFHTALRVIRDCAAAVLPAPMVVSEGANTMDYARIILPVTEARTRLDAGTWGTMGVGMGSAIAAATACGRADRLVLAVEGDSAFGFSSAELETICRYRLPIVVLVFNNGGIYGGDRRPAALRAAASAAAAAAGFGDDPAPTAFAPESQYQMQMEAFGGRGYVAGNAAQLLEACSTAFAEKQPALINIAIDPNAGVESGNVHDFNAPSTSKL